MAPNSDSARELRVCVNWVIHCDPPRRCPTGCRTQCARRGGGPPAAFRCQQAAAAIAARNTATAALWAAQLLAAARGERAAAAMVSSRANANFRRGGCESGVHAVPRDALKTACGQRLWGQDAGAWRRRHTGRWWGAAWGERASEARVRVSQACGRGVEARSMLASHRETEDCRVA